jgi:hypothetical protein
MQHPPRMFMAQPLTASAHGPPRAGSPESSAATITGTGGVSRVTHRERMRSRFGCPIPLAATGGEHTLPGTVNARVASSLLATVPGLGSSERKESAALVVSLASHRFDVPAREATSPPTYVCSEGFATAAGHRHRWLIPVCIRLAHRATRDTGVPRTEQRCLVPLRHALMSHERGNALRSTGYTADTRGNSGHEVSRDPSQRRKTQTRKKRTHTKRSFLCSASTGPVST